MLTSSTRSWTEGEAALAFSVPTASLWLRYVRSCPLMLSRTSPEGESGTDTLIWGRIWSRRCESRGGGGAAFTSFDPPVPGQAAVGLDAGHKDGQLAALAAPPPCNGHAQRLLRLLLNSDVFLLTAHTLGKVLQ